MNNNVHKYLGYAAGEIVLVIAGILIALQIDAWYEDKKVARELSTQLGAVAESISQDLASISRLKRQRLDAIFDSNRLTDITGPREAAGQWYTREYVEFASSVVASSQIPVYFVANTGAYQAIESSGNANHIKDDGLKRNLHDYYATVERIVFTEREMNNYIREVMLKYQTDTTQGFYKPWLDEPLLVWDPVLPEEFLEISLEFRVSYLELLSDSTTQAMIRSGRNQSLLREYQHLLSLGNVLVDQISAHINDEHYAIAGDEVFMADGITGPREVFDQGRFEAHSMGLFIAPTGSSIEREIDDLRAEQDHLKVSYRGGQEWLFVYVRVGSIDISVSRASLDYSRFDRIRLELKRHSGCEDLRLVLKDSEDADDGSQANVRLDLSDQWDTYEYDLTLFSDADLSRLNVVSGFLMDRNACSFSIRDVTFLKPGDA